MSADSEQRKLAAIMFTDMVGYTALSQRDDKLFSLNSTVRWKPRNARLKCKERSQKTMLMRRLSGESLRR